MKVQKRYKIKGIKSRKYFFQIDPSKFYIIIQTMNKDSFEFVIYILHACSQKWAKLPSKVYKMLNESDCINKLLVPYYDSLHTQGTRYIIGDVEDYLTTRGYKI